MRPLIAIGALAAAASLAVAGCGGDDEDIQAFCDKVEELRTADDPFAGAASGNIDGAITALREARDLMAEVSEVAPEEIQGDVDEAQAFFSEFVGAAEDAKNPQDFLAIATDFQDEAEDFQATSDRLEDYTNENCEDA
jgi:hypothetical protein